MTPDDERRLSAIRAHASDIADQTRFAKTTPEGGWVSEETDLAADMRVALDADVAFGWAHRQAQTAIRMCDEGDIEIASAFLAEAKAHYTRGLEASADPRKLEARLRPKKRGAGDKRDRDRALYLAASKLIEVDNSLGVAVACKIALETDGALATAFSGVSSDRALELAYASSVMVDNMLARDAEEGIGAFIEKRAPQWQDA